MPTFSYCQIEKRTLSASFCFCFILMLEQFPNITIQELTHSILILPRQTQLEFTLSLFLRLNCHQTYQLKTCWYSEKCNGRLLIILMMTRIFVLESALIKIIFQRHIAKDTSDILSRLSCQSLCSLVSALALDKLNKKAGQNMLEDKETKAILV